MIWHRTGLVATALCALAMFDRANANSSFDESILGDFSNDYLHPTQLALSSGNNLFKATSGWETEIRDVEYVRFDVPAGHQLSEIRYLSYSSEFGVSFISLQSGPAFTFHYDDVFS